MSNGMFKYDLSSEELRAVKEKYKRKRKKPFVAWVLWLFTGIFGAHRFYLRDKGGGFLLLFSAGGLGVLWLMDALTLPARIKRSCQAVEAEIILELRKGKKNLPSSKVRFNHSGWEEVAQ